MKILKNRTKIRNLIKNCLGVCVWGGGGGCIRVIIGGSIGGRYPPGAAVATMDHDQLLLALQCTVLEVIYRKTGKKMVLSKDLLRHF